MSAQAGQVLAIDGPNGVLFGLYHPAARQPSRGRVLLLPALAEEFNTCHRLCAQACRAMADAGFDVLRFDLSGTGDSDGRLEDLGWAQWLADGQAALKALQDASSGQAPEVPLWLWGVRGGAMLAAALAAELGVARDAAQDEGQPPQNTTLNLLWWQPITQGRQQLQQWLRLDAARQWVGPSAEERGTAGAPNEGSNAAERLMHEAVSLGGYGITPRWAADLRALKAPKPAGHGQWVWLECQGAPGSPSVAAQHHASTVAALGWRSQTLAVQAPSFWLNHGTQDAPALLAATLEAMQTP